MPDTTPDTTRSLRHVSTVLLGAAALLLVLNVANAVQEGAWSWRDAGGLLIAVVISAQALTLRLGPEARTARLVLTAVGLLAAVTALVLAFV